MNKKSVRIEKESKEYQDSDKSSQIDANQLVEKFQKIVDTRFAKYFLKNITTNDRLERILEVYSGVEPPESLKEKMQLKVVSSAIKRSTGTFKFKESDAKELLKESFVRKAVALTLRSVSENGLGKPQIFSAPFLIVWNITNQCNLRCEHCYASAGVKNPEELTLEEKKKFVDELSKIGTFMISFAGGEPLISRDFWEVANYAREKGIYTSIATNGTLLTKENVNRLHEIGVRYIEISLDSSIPEIHDKFRGVNGAFQKTVEGIKNIVEHGGFETGIATVATKFNLDTVPLTMEFAKGLGVNRFIVFNFVPTGRGLNIIKQDLSPSEREKLLEMLYESWQRFSTDSKGKMGVFSTSPTYSRIGIQKILEGQGETFSPTHFAGSGISSTGVAIAEFIGGCGAGRMYAGVEDNGDVTPCVFLPIKVGNLREKSFQDIWKNSDTMKTLRNRDNLKGYCAVCDFKNDCGGCRARAYGYFGDLNAPDPGCIYNDTYYDELFFSADFKKKKASFGTTGENKVLDFPFEN